MKALVRYLDSIIQKLDSEGFKIGKIEIELSVFDLIKSNLGFDYSVKGVSNMQPPIYFKVYSKYDIFRKRPKEFGLPDIFKRRYNINDIA